MVVEQRQNTEGSYRKYSRKIMRIRLSKKPLGNSTDGRAIFFVDFKKINDNVVLYFILEID